MKRTVSLGLAALLCLGAAGESRLAQYQRLRQEAGAAAQAGDLATAEARLEAALKIVPTSPGNLIRLARVEVAAGKPEEAIAHLRAYAALDLSWDVASDPALKSLMERPDFALLAEGLVKLGQLEDPVEVVARLPAGTGIHEGVLSYDGGFLVSSVTGRSILKIKDGATTPFFGSETTVGLFGMALDGEHLWAAEAAGPDVPGASGPARTALLKIRLRDGQLISRIPVVDDGGPHQLGDVLVTGEGEVLASDGRSGQIWRLAKGGSSLEEVVGKGQLGSPQGMAVCAKSVVVVADYTLGLHRLDLATGRLDPIGGVPVASAGTDGLFRIRGPHTNRPDMPVFALVQNGVTPERVVQVGLDAECRDVGFVGFLVNHRLIGDVTLGAARGDRFVFISRSGWASHGGDGRRDPKAPPVETLILSARMEEGLIEVVTARPENAPE